MAKVEKRLVTTPKVEAKWIYLDKPNTRFSEDGGYEITLLFDPDNKEHKKFLDELEVIEQELRNELTKTLPAAKRKTISHEPFVKEDIDAEGNETGYLKIKAKSKYPPAVFDAKLNQITPPSNLGNGTIVRANIGLKPVLVGRKMFISCYLQAVQLIEVQTFQGGTDPAALGFTPEEGFVVEETLDLNDDADF